MAVDLRTCKLGDILISKHGARLVYIGPCDPTDYMDHNVAYEDPMLGNGTRTHDGFVFRKRRLETDHDIVRIIKI